METGGVGDFIGFVASERIEVGKIEGRKVYVCANGLGCRCHGAVACRGVRCVTRASMCDSVVPGIVKLRAQEAGKMCDLSALFCRSRASCREVWTLRACPGAVSSQTPTQCMTSRELQNHGSIVSPTFHLGSSQSSI